jgi:ABC-2 type transport system ATP-binding protein
MERSSVRDAPLRTEGFGRRYRRNRPWAVRGVFLTVPSGSVTALVGPNGAGKSTLMRACLGFERADEGRVLVSGVDPQRHRSAAVASIGYVPQGASLYRSLTIGDHLFIASAARQSFDPAYARGRLEELGLSEKRPVGQLSSGEQAQVALTLALGTRAPVLLLDEPLASLDPLARRDFLVSLMADIRVRSTTVLLSSHIVTDVEQICDRVVVIADGRVALDTSVALAKNGFRTLPAVEIEGHAAIGTFAGPDGKLLSLVPESSIGHPASLEEIVLGHLAAGRDRPGEGAA